VPVPDAKHFDALAKSFRKAGRSLRQDGWQNAFTGLGGSRDKSANTKWRFSGKFLQPEELDLLYAENDLCQTIVGAIVDDALREGIELRPAEDSEEGEEGETLDPESDTDDAKEAQAELDAWGVTELVREARIWGRLYGRAGLLLVVKNGGLAEEPLKDDAGELIDIIVVDRRELQPRTYYQDPTEAKFGQPETYMLTVTSAPGTQATGVVVHESRFVLFGGTLTPKRIKIVNDMADLSVLQSVYDVLKKTESNWDAVCSALTDMSQGVIKIKGLIEAIAAGKTDALAARFELMDAMKSMLRTLPLDAEDEEFEYVERGSLSGVEGLIDKSFQRVATAAKMPVTRLLRVSPGGLNATGASDIQLWYDEVRAEQRIVLKPAIQKLVDRICGPGWEVCFPDLEKQNPLEEAQIHVAQATADNTYVTMGALTPSEIAKCRFGKGHWAPGYDNVDMAPHEAALDREHEELVNPPEPPAIDPALGADPSNPEASDDGTDSQEKPPEA